MRIPIRASLSMALAAILLSSCTTARSAAPGRLLVAVTMDDLPVHGPLPAGETRQSVTERVVAALRAAGVAEAYGFVNAAAIEADPSLASALTAWAAAGYPLANHGFAHRRFDDLTLDQFEAELDRNAPYLEKLGGGRDWRWFRYPFLAEGEGAARTAAHRLLAARGYRIAGVTMDFFDWQFSDAYVRCRDASDETGLAKLERAYLDAVRESVERSRALSEALYGRDIPYVLLTHISAFNAHMLPRVLDLYRELGFGFVSLADAYVDPAYRDGDVPHATLEEKAGRRGLPIPEREDRTAMIAAICR